MAKKTQQRGITLIELMIVIGIIGILSAIAIPSYQNYVIRTYRGQAQADLLACRQAMERFYVTRSPFSYTGATAGTTCPATSPSDQGAGAARYDIVINVTDSQTYSLNANPRNGTSQAGDITYRLNSNGTKSASLNGTDFTEGWSK